MRKCKIASYLIKISLFYLNWLILSFRYFRMPTFEPAENLNCQDLMESYTLNVDSILITSLTFFCLPAVLILFSNLRIMTSKNNAMDKAFFKLLAQLLKPMSALLV